MTYTTGSDWNSGLRSQKPGTATPDNRSAAQLKDSHIRRLNRQDFKPNTDFDLARARGKKQNRYTISALMDDGEICDFDHPAPADLYLEDICACFGRGALIATKNGQVAIEDLRPGDQIRTRDNGYQRLRWISACNMPINSAEISEEILPIRIKASALGEYRPIHDLVVSPRFRLLSNHPSCEALFGSAETLAPAVDLLDGDTILRVRPADDMLFYNLRFDDHQIIEANGLETESYHPGNFGVAVMSLELQSHLRQIFPHLSGDLQRFGRTVRPILKGFEAEVLRVG